MTALSGKLPAGDGNGLIAIAQQLCEEPHTRHLAVCIIDCQKVTTNMDTGEVIPTARVRRVEVIAGDEDRKVLERLMRRALDERTGREALPYDLQTEIEGIEVSQDKDGDDDE